MNEPTPVLNPDCDTYCEACGDCLDCYGEDSCYDGGGHTWPPPRDDETYPPDQPTGGEHDR